MNIRSAMKALQAAERRLEREAQRRHRELLRTAKEQAKLSALEHARFEVDSYVNQLDVLLSVHKDVGPSCDWRELAASLPPPTPLRRSYHELQAKIARALSSLTPELQLSIGLEHSRKLDDEDFSSALLAHSAARAAWEERQTLAELILAGNLEAYAEVFSEWNPLAELTDLGSSITFAPYSVDLVSCNLHVKAADVIPKESKTLNSTGKVTTKALPRARFQELYQDYVCSCILRVGREILALLPVTTALVTARADLNDLADGPLKAAPVLSVALTRAGMASLDFEGLDPSDTVETFFHRGDFKASRRAGAFQPITPLKPEELLKGGDSELSLNDLVGTVRSLRQELNRCNTRT